MKYFSPIKLGILPVELTYWEIFPGKPKEGSAIPFDYKGKRNVISYIGLKKAARSCPFFL